MQVPTEPCERAALVTYRRPTATVLPLHKTVTMTGPNEIMPLYLRVGKHTREFVATVQQADGSGRHQATCSFSIHVIQITCPQLTAPDNGYIKQASCDNAVGSMVTFQCQKDYRLVGNATVTCTRNGTWNAQPPSCSSKVKTCPALVTTSNGTKWKPDLCSKDTVPAGTSCSIQCDSNLLPSVKESAKCLTDGTWSIDVQSAKCTGKNTEDMLHIRSHNCSHG